MGDVMADRTADALFDAFVDEGRALQQLRTVLEEQRGAVAEHDREAVERSVNSISRVMLTLDAARRRRDELVTLVTGKRDMAMPELVDILESSTRPDVVEACRSVLEIGQTVRRDVIVNQHVIDRTLEIGNRFLQQLLTEGDAPQLEGSSAGGLMVDRQA